jgi:flagellar biosynthesis/type III secretory pathway protein FliH
MLDRIIIKSGWCPPHEYELPIVPAVYWLEERLKKLGVDPNDAKLEEAIIDVIKQYVETLDSKYQSGSEDYWTETLRDKFEDEYVFSNSNDPDHQEAYDKGYEEGLLVGRKNAEEDAEDRYQTGYNSGYAQGLKESVKLPDY